MPIRILVVEDDLVLNFVNCETLRDNGFNAVGVHGGDSAFEMVDREAGWSALVTDIELGTGPDGFEVARRARAANPDLHVVFVSGAEAARRRAEGIDGSEFLRKPFQPTEIVEALDRLGCRNTGER